MRPPKSRSPVWSQIIPLSYPQLKRPPATFCHQEKDMTLHSTFLLVFLSATLAFCHLQTAQRAARELKESVRERRRIGQTRTQDRQSRSVSTLEVLDFSADGDQQPDSDNEYTGATLEAGPQWLIRLKTQKKITGSKIGAIFRNKLPHESPQKVWKSGNEPFLS